MFKALDLSHVRNKNISVGRTGYSRHAMIRAFIVKHQQRIKSVPELIDFLDAHPGLSLMCGFEPGKIPHEAQFYRFLAKTNNSILQNLHHDTNKKLIDKKIISMNHFIMDSKPVMAATKQNNFKNPKRNTHDKNKKPKRNPAATLGYYSYQSINGKKDNFIFFWGYRTHVIVSKEGIPLIEITLPNNMTDQKAARKIINKLKRVYRFKKGCFFIADAAYDATEFYEFIVHKFKGQAFIPLQKTANKYLVLGPKGTPICQAGLDMISDGKVTDCIQSQRTHIKFRCPFKARKAFAKNNPQGCPINHEKFHGYGCTKYINITNNARSNVPRDSRLFKDTYALRMEVERYFARLGDREAEQTTHYKLKSVKNQMTIAHLSLSLIAYAAAILIQQPQKIRCYRSFANDCKPLALAG